MKKLITVVLMVTILSSFMLVDVFAKEGLVAFPGAEGYGKNTVGGRGGKVCEVTTLKATGPGSLGAAIGEKGPRTVVFRVAGTITGDFKIRNDKITIAGQTAPGDGICIKGKLSINANDVIVRYIRVRPNAKDDSIGGSHGKKNIILDHVSASWSADEVLSIYQDTNVTFQYCMITEACSSDHKFGGIWGNYNSTYHHNLLAHNASRNPRWASNGGAGSNDFRNNVIYNWGYMTCYGGAGNEPVNMVANYYKPGPATEKKRNSLIAKPSGGVWYVADNFMHGNASVTKDNWKGVQGGKKSNTPWNAMPIRMETAEKAYKTVLDTVGCSKPNRDAVDKRIIEEVRTGTAKYGKNGLITTPSDVGGWPKLASGKAPLDSDHDGMPDSWETANGLNPKNASDRNKKDSVGYTMLEKYINSDELVSVTHNTKAVVDNSSTDTNKSKDTTTKTNTESAKSETNNESSKNSTTDSKSSEKTTESNMNDSNVDSDSNDSVSDVEEKGADSAKESETNENKNLPKSGETANTISICVGFFILLIGALFFVKRSKYN